MAAKIPVQVHIGVTPMPLPTDRVLAEMRVSVLEMDTNTLHQGSIGPEEQPVVDEFGNSAFTVDFPEVQSGQAVHVSAKCLDAAEQIIGIEVTHEVTLDEVPDPEPGATFLQPQSIFLTT